MSIFKRGRVYWFHFYFQDQHIQLSTRQRNPNVARQIEAAYRTQLAKGEVGIHERKAVPKFDKAIQHFLTWSKDEHQAHPATYRRYLTSSKALVKHFGSTPLDKITPDDVEKFKTIRSKQFKMPRPKKNNPSGRIGKRAITNRSAKVPTRIRPATVNRELACLKAMFNHVIKTDVPLRNPVSRVKFLPEDNEQTRILSPNEQKQYLAVTTQPLTDIAVLMLETGMRPEEVYRIERKNVHLAQSLLFNPYGKTKAARRKIPLTQTAIRVLSTRLRAGDSSFIFPCETDPNRPIPKINNSHDRALALSKLPKFRLYDLRHTWATRAAMSGIDLVTLAAMLGHSRIQMVLRYAHPTEDHQAEAMKKLEQFNADQIMAAEAGTRHPATDSYQ